MLHLDENKVYQTKFKFKGYEYPVKVVRVGQRLWLEYPFNREMTDEFKKCFHGMKWHGYDDKPIKKWSISYNAHNMFQIDFFMGNNPYKRYMEDYTITSYDPQRPCREHQIDMVKFMFYRRQCIIAGEMGVGKTLSGYELIELVQPNYAVWVAPNSALTSVKVEREKWGIKSPIQYYTYDGIKKFECNDPPQVIFFDESQKIKTVNTQRTSAARQITDEMRRYYGDNCYIILMTGTPSPKSPVDWYAQAEIACPGYLKEGDQHKFKNRLAVIRTAEGAYGSYPELVTWLDDETKCAKCGLKADDPTHTVYMDHKFEKSVNEIEFLHKRLQGLVLVKLKKDCVQLPDKVYDIIECTPSTDTLRAMKMIIKTSPTTIEALTRCRELSDGFLYDDKSDGRDVCPGCNGTKVVYEPVYRGPQKTHEFLHSLGVEVPEDFDPEDIILTADKYPDLFVWENVACYNCNGTGDVDKRVRTTNYVGTPKDKELENILEYYDDVGRVVIYAGFTASIDKIAGLVHKKDWDFIRVDGRGWTSNIGGSPQDLLREYQSGKRRRIAFIGHPDAAGTGLTLTASPVIVYYSNDFKGESRSQSEDRIHRMGMDENRGARIVDLIHLPVDKYVLDNLKNKRRLENITLGKLIEDLGE